MFNVMFMGEMGDACNVLVRIPEGMMPLGRPTHKKVK
jgi:hypothetical protein